MNDKKKYLFLNYPKSGLTQILFQIRYIDFKLVLIVKTYKIVRNPLQCFTIQRTNHVLFDLLVNDGREKAISFLAKDRTEQWPINELYTEMQEKVGLMNVVCKL